MLQRGLWRAASGATTANVADIANAEKAASTTFPCGRVAPALRRCSLALSRVFCQARLQLLPFDAAGATTAAAAHRPVRV